MTDEPDACGARPSAGFAHPADADGRTEALSRSEPPTGRCVPADGGGRPPIALRLDLLNGFRLTRDDHMFVLPRGAERLLAYMALTGRRARPHVAGALWDDMGAEQALACLRTALWRLGRLCPGALATTPESIDISDDVVVDVQRFRAVARMLIDHQLPSGADHYAVVDLMKMDLLPGWYDDWVIVEREQLRQLGLHALETLSAQLLGHGEYASALEAALVAIASEPMRESAYRAAARVHLAEGNVVEARKQYEAYRQMMSMELGASPSREFADLVGREEVSTPHQRRGQVSCGKGEPAGPPAEVILKAISGGLHPLQERPVGRRVLQAPGSPRSPRTPLRANPGF